MRILTGRHKGRAFNIKIHKTMRPTQDKLRMAIINMMISRIEAANTLELFAGSGMVSMELISNGAKFATCVDISPVNCNSIRKIAEALDIAQSIEVIRQDFLKALHFLVLRERRYDIIFADPPYESSSVADLFMQFEILSRLMHDESRLIIETSKKKDLPINDQNYLRMIEKREYGDTALWIFERLTI